MLRRASVAFALLVSLCAGAAAQAHDGHESLRRPERVTVGINDQFLGQLSPDEKTLYFVSSQETRREIYAQDMEEGRARMVFDEGADVTWPRAAPNGKRIAYISFSQQATGQLCVRDLPDGDHRRCLSDTLAALQAEWIDDTHLAVVGRTSIDGDLRVSVVDVRKKKLKASTLYDRNWANLALTPDGRWLVYVPLDRVAKRVGPGFAARAARRLEAVRLGVPGEPHKLVADLPGMTGQPAFSRDGQTLYFTQFFSDSNHDGTIDASDHGVLFSLPFPSADDDAPAKAAALPPRQLTDSSANCQYPAPSAHTLITTCSHGHELSIYQLPLDGEIPSEWTNERLRRELSLGAKREDQLLLYRHALAYIDDLQWRRLLTMRLVFNHLELEEFDAANFYARKVEMLKDPHTQGIGRPILSLVAHRRSRSATERGRSVESFVGDAKMRFEQLEARPKEAPAARVLDLVVRSEIADSLGDKVGARRELEAAVIEDTTPRTIVEAYYARANALYRALDDRAALLAVALRFANNAGLPEDVRLDYARHAAATMARGLPYDEADALLAKERDKETGDTELAFAIDVRRATIAIREQRPPPEVKDRLLALYDSQSRPDRKRALVLDALQQAADLCADGVIEALAERYVDDVERGTEERRRAERIYRRALMGRAFRRLSHDHIADAKVDFDDVFARTGSLEAVVGSIDIRLRQGEKPDAILASLDPKQRDAPHTHFIRAYLIANQLHELSGERHDAAVAEARRLVRDAWGVLKNKAAARALLGSIAHEDFIRSGNLASAETANSHYLVAVEMLQNDPRYLATVVGQLGLLNAEVGNYRIALDYLERRAKLPLNDDVEAFAVRLATAHSLLHVGRDADSAAQADEALALVERVPELAFLHTLALDRAALANLSAHRFERALALYDREVPLLEKADDQGAKRNRFVVRLARAAAAVGAGQAERALQDLDVVEPSLTDSALIEVVTPEHVSTHNTALSYGCIVAGLRANANRALGRLEAATAALTLRRTLFERRFKESKREEDARSLTLVETRLAEVTSTKDAVAANGWIQAALARADALVPPPTVGSVVGALPPPAARVDLDQARVLRVAAELSLLYGVPVSFDVTGRLQDAHSRMAKERDPLYRNYQRWFEIYLAMLHEPTATVQK